MLRLGTSKRTYVRQPPPPPAAPALGRPLVGTRPIPSPGGARTHTHTHTLFAPDAQPSQDAAQLSLDRDVRASLASVACPCVHVPTSSLLADPESCPPRCPRTTSLLFVWPLSRSSPTTVRSCRQSWTSRTSTSTSTYLPLPNDSTPKLAQSPTIDTDRDTRPRT